MQLSSKTAIITGGGSGIGESTAKLFAAQGARVMIADWNEENGKRVVEEINREVGMAFFTKTDVSSESDVIRLIR